MSTNPGAVPFSRSFEAAEAAPTPPPDVQSGDLAARMYEQHHAELYRSALRACRDPGTAEDLV